MTADALVSRHTAAIPETTEDVIALIGELGETLIAAKSWHDVREEREDVFISLP